VLYVGCGLDTRITRINPPASVTWFDVDYPEVIRLRKNFYSDGDGYKMIECSVTETGWLQEIPNNRPTLIIAEGLLEYLTAEEVKIFLQRVTDYFQHGQMIFDVMNSFAIKSGKEKLKNTTGAIHKWAVDDVKDVDTLNSRLKRIIEMPVFKSVYVRQLPFKFRLFLNFMCLIPQFKNMMRLLQYRF
jgi:O-methyltransferase involved in polyketide biosynthesis